MRRIRWLVVSLIVWLLLFYGLEWRSPWPGFAGVADALAPIVAVTALLVPRLHRLGPWPWLGLVAAAFLVAKWITQTPIADGAWRLTVTEAAFLAVLTLLGRWLSQALAEFEQSVLAMSLGSYGERRARQGEIYREIHRARLHQRPLAVLALVYDGGGPEPDRVAREAEAAMRRHYLAARVARAARGVLDDYQIMAKQDDHFVIVLPETGPEAVATITDRVRQAVQAEVGVNVRIGVAFMPDDAATFEGLLEQAVNATNGSPELAAHRGLARPLPAPDAVRQPESAHGIPHTQ